MLVGVWADRFLAGINQHHSTTVYCATLIYTSHEISPQCSAMKKNITPGSSKEVKTFKLAWYLSVWTRQILITVTLPFHLSNQWSLAPEVKFSEETIIRLNCLHSGTSVKLNLSSLQNLGRFYSFPSYNMHPVLFLTEYDALREKVDCPEKGGISGKRLSLVACL